MRGPTVIHTHVHLNGREIALAIQDDLYDDAAWASPSAVRK